jgi:hypothetical protein
VIVIKVELHSAITGKVSEIAKMHIFNDGTGDRRTGNYTGIVFRKDTGAATRDGKVLGYKRLNLHVWNLIARMLQSMGYK